jgi:pectate lyase
VRGSDFVTITASRFVSNDKSNLIGNGDGSRRWSDEGRLRVTMSGNHWDYNQARMPRVRYGKVHLYNNYYGGSIVSVPNRKWGSGIAVGYEGNVLAEGNFFRVMGLKINASNEICGKLIHHHGSGTGFRANNLWFQSDHASALTPVHVDTFLNACDGLPLATWSPPYDYVVDGAPPGLATSIPLNAGAGRLH